MRSDLNASTDRSLEELMISLDQLTQKLEVRLAQAQRLKKLLYQRTENAMGTCATAQELAELERIRAASLRLLAMQGAPSTRSLH